MTARIPTSCAAPAFAAAIFWRTELANVSRQPRIRASIPITFAQMMIVQRMIKNSAASVSEIYT